MLNIKKGIVQVVRSNMFVPVAGLVGSIVGTAVTIVAIKAVDRAVWGAIPKTLQFAAGYGGATIGKEAGMGLALVTQNMVGTGWDDLLEDLREAEEAAAEAHPS